LARAVLALSAGLLAALVLGSASARADADPASDMLIQADVFYPFGTSVSQHNKEELTAAVTAGKQNGVRLKIALIAQRTDLGAVTVLYKKPQQYAKFLGTELFYVNDARVLVVMPNGYGLWRRGGKLDKRELSTVHAVAPPGSTDGNELAAGAFVAARRLLAVHGITVAVPKSTSSRTSDRLELAAGALAIVAAGLAVATLRRRWMRRHAG
jgi:hypothetical protein